jgi:hypothetical protein
MRTKLACLAMLLALAGCIVPVGSPYGGYHGGYHGGYYGGYHRHY